jgi:hypothetical protein
LGISKFIEFLEALSTHIGFYAGFKVSHKKMLGGFLLGCKGANNKEGLFGDLQEFE